LGVVLGNIVLIAGFDLCERGLDGFPFLPLGALGFGGFAGPPFLVQPL
jgi:hypothetical protein